jgi:hypothetical protein
VDDTLGSMTARLAALLCAGVAVLWLMWQVVQDWACCGMAVF